MSNSVVRLNRITRRKTRTRPRKKKEEKLKEVKSKHEDKEEEVRKGGVVKEGEEEKIMRSR